MVIPANRHCDDPRFRGASRAAAVCASGSRSWKSPGSWVRSFCSNNLHSLHHEAPLIPWYEYPAATDSFAIALIAEKKRRACLSQLLRSSAPLSCFAARCAPAPERPGGCPGRLIDQAGLIESGRPRFRVHMAAMARTTLGRFRKALEQQKIGEWTEPGPARGARERRAQSRQPYPRERRRRRRTRASCHGCRGEHPDARREVRPPA